MRGKKYRKSYPCKKYNRKRARMAVPKLVLNGFNSLFRGWVSLRGIKFEWRTGTVVNDKKRIITIFDHFRNRHARSFKS